MKTKALEMMRSVGLLEGGVERAEEVDCAILVEWIANWKI